jgi:antibiotic biosynthesis monooxygenase (ABM) superfamily enzyme
MTVTILMERVLDASQQPWELMDLLQQLRARALRQPDYVSGETRVSVDNMRTHLVISRWSSLEHWRAWEHSPERAQMLAKIAPLLASPEKSSLFTETSVTLAEGV